MIVQLHCFNVGLTGGNVTDLGGIDGVSQWQTLTSTVPSVLPRREFLYNIDEIYNNSAIRLDSWKLIQGIYLNYKNVVKVSEDKL